LAAWATSSVILDRQRRAVAQLAQWGSARPGELAALLRRFADVDDVQVVESVAVAAAGAVLNLIEHGSADELARAAHAAFFENRGEKNHPNVVARHAARLVIERAFKIGTDLSMDIHDDATPPYFAAGPKLPIDAETVSENRGPGRGGGDAPLSSDLDWHVANLAIDPFFSQVSHYRPERNNRRFGRVPEQILNAVVDGRLNINAEVFGEISGEIEQRAQHPKYFSITDLVREVGATEDEQDDHDVSGIGMAGRIDEDLAREFFEAFESTPPGQQPPRMGVEAEAMLAEYAHELLENEPLSPKQIGNGLIVALVKKWGGNKETFYGDPRGGEAGEELGADIAIQRQHQRATHGSRSSVATFGEKYVWSAVNVVSTFLCDRLPGKTETGSELEFISNQSELGSGMPDPLVGHRPDKVPDLRPPWAAKGIAAAPDLTETRQPDRGIQWLERAEWPKPEEWFSSGGDESILLSAFLFSEDHQAGVQMAAWVSCVAVPRAQLHLIERDINIAPELWVNHSTHKIEGHFEGGFYAPLRLTVWLPWSIDGKPEDWHSISDSGEPVAIPLYPLVTKAIWDGTEGETTARSPSKLLRDVGEIIDCCGPDSALQFVDRDRREVAYFQRTSFPDDWSKTNNYLQIQRSLLSKALTEQDLVPVWGVRVYRELLPALRPNGGWVDQDAYWMVLPSGDGLEFRSLLVSSENRDERESSTDPPEAESA